MAEQEKQRNKDRNSTSWWVKYLATQVEIEGATEFI